MNYYKTSIFSALVILFLVIIPFSTNISADIPRVTKIMWIHERNIPNSYIVNEESQCGSNDNLLVEKVDIDLVIWSNYKYDLRLSTRGHLFDNVSGEKIGQVSATINDSHQPFNGYPITRQTNVEVTCIGTGAKFLLHSGYTVDRQFQLHIHHSQA